MPVDIAVINASPFILLCKCGLIDLMPKLFPDVLMPQSVSNEIARGDDIASELLNDFRQTWLTCRLVKIQNEVEIWNLGDGETEVLSLVFASKRNHLALIDDRAARRCADTLGIRTLGTAGLLVLAKTRNLIPTVRPELEKLTAAGLYISNDLERAILEQADELN